MKIEPWRFVTPEWRKENGITARHILIAGLDLFNHTYTIYASNHVCNEEDLDIALNHYMFLRKNNCVPFIVGNKFAKTL